MEKSASREAALERSTSKDTLERSASRETLDETFESLTPYIPEDVPQIEQVDTPPLISTPKSEHSKFKNKLSALASPFKTSKGFNLGAIKRSKLLDKEEDSDRDGKDVIKKTKKVKKNKRVDNDELGAEIDGEGALSGGEEKRKKKSGARSKAGALVKRFGSLRGKKPEVSVEPAADERRASSGSSSLTPGSVKRRTSECEDGPVSEHSVNDESGSRYGSVEDVDMSAPIADSENTSTEEPTSSIPIDIAAVSTTHPVSTLPFAKSTWKPKAKSFEIERPIESPSPEDALRRRIAFVEQTTICISEDHDDLPYSDSDPESAQPAAPRLSRMVQLAKTALTPEAAPKEARSRSPSPSKTVEKTDDEEYEDTEEPTPKPVMTAHGDLIEEPGTSTADMGSGASTSTPSLSADKREHLYKILVIGELGAGKTSIIKRYVHQFFSQHYRATIGVDFALKVLNWDQNTTVRLQLWDIAGQERFGNMTRVYYKEAVAAFIVFDVTRVATFDAVVKWKQDLDSKVQLPDGSQIPCVLLANKCDQQKEGVVNSIPKMDEFCREKGFAGWFETSAKENINIDEAARFLVNKILNNDRVISNGDNKDSDKIVLEDAAANKTKKCAC